jgi:arylsulfatase A-like enzyme
LEKEYPPREGSKRLFLFLYYFDPHVWYDPLPPFNALYDPDYTGTLTPAVFGHGGDVVSGKIVPTARDVEHMLAMYDGEISYWDARIGEMLTYLQDNHYLDNALVVVTADHGEMFGEHGRWVHANGLNEEVLRVPLLMRYTGVIPPGNVVKAPSQNYDLMPTILDWAGVSLPGDLQAVSLRVVSLGGAGDMDRPLYSEIDGVTNKRDDFYWIAPRTPLRSIEQRGWKLIHSPGHAELDELYQLQPGSLYETENLIQSQPNRLAPMLKLLNAWFGLKR